MKRAMNTDLDQTVDETTFYRECQVACPVPWCAGHTSRAQACGDADGPFCGIHVSRITAQKRWSGTLLRRYNRWVRLGLTPEHAEQAVSIDLQLVNAREQDLDTFLPIASSSKR